MKRYEKIEINPTIKAIYMSTALELSRKEWKTYRESLKRAIERSGIEL